MVDTNNYSPERWVNYADSVPVKLGLYESSAESAERGCIPKNIGTRIALGDRVFRLSRAVAALTIGEIVVPDASGIMNSYTTELVADGSTIGVTAAVTAGSHEFSIRHTSAFDNVEKNELADGTLHISDGAGEGHCYTIRSNGAYDSSIDGCTIELYDPIKVALDTTTSDMFVVPNLYREVTTGTLGTDDHPLGLATFAVDGSSTAQYCWVQTWGMATAKGSEAGIAPGDNLAYDNDGVIKVADEDEPIIGIAVTAQGDAEHLAVYLMLAP